ncbi:MAG: thioether cross-link-forming SCIFF peptide maturase [Defluviitaleaceae bacterium]|nr:thioether cross-link-forming SCIFF peptide maturase [Defluviitaleaceae bacterium]
MIHCFSMGTRNIVLDVNSGALHLVDDAAFAVLEGLCPCSPTAPLWECRPEALTADKADEGSTLSSALSYLSTAPPEIADEIRALIDKKQLFSPAKPREITNIMQNRRPVIKALCLHIAHECNLRCAYCFARQGSYSDSDRGLMSFDVGKRAIDFLIEKSGTRRNLEVDFFGGEPMLNFDVVKKIVAYGRECETQANKNFRFTLTTNATLLSDENINYINENFDNVVLSIDGRKHVNDCMRPRNGGGGSYDIILPNIKALTKAREGSYYVRGTYTRHNTDFAADVKHLASEGFKHISVEPVVAPSSADYALREQDLPVLFREYEKLAQFILENPHIKFFHFEMDIDGGPCVAKRVTGCGAGSEYLAVTPSGKLYPCHQFVGDERFQVGELPLSSDCSVDVLRKTQNINEVGALPLSSDCQMVGMSPRSLDTPPEHENLDFSNCHVFTKPECEKCWAKYYCSGGCIATAYYANGDIKKPDKLSCELMRKRIECALYVYVERSGG